MIHQDEAVEGQIYRSLALGILLEARNESASLNRRIQRSVSEIREARYIDKKLHSRKKADLQKHILEKRSINRFTKTPWFREICYSTGLLPERIAHAIHNATDIYYTGSRGI